MTTAFVSPGAYSLEKDFSLYAPALATSTLGIVLTASKGPINERTLITDEGSLRTTFGPGSSTHLGLLAAARFLRKGNMLWVVRVGTYYTYPSDLTFQNAAATVDTLRVYIPEDLGPGSWANNVSVKIETGTKSGTFKLTVLENDATVEVYDLLLMGTANVDEAQYLPTRINAASQYISVEVLAEAQTTLEVSSTATNFAGGTDGAPVGNYDLIGSIGSPPVVEPTGLQLFRDPDDVDINMLAVPGYHNRQVISEMISIAEERADCLAILNTPAGLSVSQAVDWHNGELLGDDDYPTAALNTSYAALYYGYGTIYDFGSDADIEVPFDGHVAGVIAFTDKVADPWQAPAGFRRAKLADVQSIEHSPTQGERDYMYANGNSLNPIVNFSGEGIVVWGQRTLQRSSTSLDRINVRRLLLYMRKVIATSTRYLVFEPNDETTWRQFVNLVSPVCQMIKDSRGLYDFRVICDETTNTAVRQARNELFGRVLIQPTKTAEMVVSEFNLVPTGASFTEFTQ